MLLFFLLLTYQFLAVAAHPPESSYHKIGAPLTGRGLVQIWCVLNDKFKEEYVPSQVIKNSTQPQRPRGRPRKRPVSESEDDTKPKKKKGRPRKIPVSESEDDSYIDIEQVDSSLKLVPNLESGNTHDQVATKYPVRKKKISGQLMSAEPQQTPGNIGKVEIKSPVENKASGRSKKVTRNKPEDQYVSVQLPEVNTSGSEKEIEFSRPSIRKGRPKKKSGDAPEGIYMEALAIEYPESTSYPINESPASTASARRALKNKDRKGGNDHENDLPSLSKEGTSESIKKQVPSNCGEFGRLDDNVTDNGHLKMVPSRCTSCKNVEIPRPVLCLAHNGKVAWDVKWRPSDSFDADSKHRMGYLAVLLGNGALEV